MDRIVRSPALTRIVRAPNQPARIVRSTALTRVVHSGGGPRGAPGAPSSPISYTHTQAVAAQTWTVNHNLGLRPVVAVLTPGGVEVEAAVTHLSTNQLQIDFAAPQAGVARCL